MKQWSWRKPSMKQRIYWNLCLTSLAALVLSTIASLLLYYDFYNSRSGENLMMQAEALASGLTEMQIDNSPTMEDFLQRYQEALQKNKQIGVRITLIRADDGEVLFDTAEDQAVMETHQDRPEVVEAIQKGYGQDVRMSETIGISTHYAAVYVEGENLVLRVSSESSNLIGIFIRMVPFDVLAVVVLFLISMFVANKLTEKIIEPLDEIAEGIRKMDAPSSEMDNIKVYEELQPFIDSVKQSQRVREEFSANVSHELKTPLTSISGFAEMMKSGMVTDKEHIQEFSETIYNESQRLLSLIDDIMRLSRIEEGGEEIGETLNMFQIANEINRRLSDKAAKYGVSVDLSGTPAYIVGNRTMIEEMIYNLIDNAIKYNHPGGHVYLITGMRNNDAKNLNEEVNPLTNIEGMDISSFITVADDGIGIPHSDLDRVWERFYRVDKSHSRAIGGTGLGLSIVKHVAERHHAKIDINSSEGEGTKITVTFALET